MDYEHIIQDGLSTDQTIPICRQTISDKHFIYSEKDNGLYQALNSAIKKANGRYVIILHADDFFPHEHVLKKIHGFIVQEKFPNLVYGDLNYVDYGNLQRVVRRWKSGEFRKGAFYEGWMPPHPALVVEKQIFEFSGYFNETFRISGDYEWMLRVFEKFSYSMKYFPEVLVHMRTGGLSNKGMQSRLLAWKEDKRAWEINGLKPKFYTLLKKKFGKIFQYF
jgi:glycosyltransferase